jgi:hypothetical protein
MATLTPKSETYRTIIKQLLTQYATYKPSHGDIETQTIFVISHSNRKGLMRKPPEPPDYPGNRGGGEHPDEAMSSKR